MSKNVINNTDDLDLCFARFKSKLLTLHLQLAEESKRSGEFETTYKNESGKEIKVVRSPDGKFASKGGGGSTSSDSGSKGSEEKENVTTGNAATEMMKNLLNGDAGKQLKQGIISAIDKASKNSTVKNVAGRVGDAIAEANLKTGVQQAKFSEILGNGSDAAIGNAEKYIKNQLDDIAKGASDSEMWQRIGKTLVGALVAGACVGAGLAAAGASAPIVAGGVVGAYTTTLAYSALQENSRISKRNADNFKNRFAIAAKKDADAKFAAMIKRLDDEAAQKKLLEDIKTVAEVKRAESKPSKPGEKPKPIFESTKDLDARVKDLEKRTEAANKAMEEFNKLDITKLKRGEKHTLYDDGNRKYSVTVR